MCHAGSEQGLQGLNQRGTTRLYCLLQTLSLTEPAQVTLAGSCDCLLLIAEICNTNPGAPPYPRTLNPKPYILGTGK